MLGLRVFRCLILRNGSMLPQGAPLLPTYRYAIGETVLLALGRPNVSWRAEYKVVGYIWPGDQEVRYVIRSTSRASERIAREHEISTSH
jgi:hypothetical protein